jgi:hypothetical protein
MSDPSAVTEPIFIQTPGPPRPRWVPPAMASIDFTSAAHTDRGPINSWVVTFDEAWRASTHRTPLPGARRCHPDGFVLVRSRALDIEAVRPIVATVFGGEFREIELYDPAVHASRRRFPLGCIGTYDATLRHWVGAGL